MRKHQPSSAPSQARAGPRSRFPRRLGVLDWVAIALLAAGLVLTGTGMLPAHDASATMARILPLLLFLATILVLAELTAAAGVFDMIATRLAIAARGNFAGLFALCVTFAAATTIALNLDTTAVLLTPVMLALARTLRVPGRGEPLSALPLAMCTVWLANTASLLLPVSNLTNLLAANRVALAPPDFAARMASPQAAAVLVTAALLWACYWRRGCRGAERYEPPRAFEPGDRWLMRIAGSACLFFVAALLGGVVLGLASAIAAAVVLLAFAIRRRPALRWSLIPWRLPAFVTGMFLVVQTLSVHLLHPAMSALVGPSGGVAGTFRAAATGAVLANLVNNLPAYLAGEAAVPVANHTQLLGLLIGVNVGPLILPWASLATLLWYERCSAAGLTVPLRKFMVTGAALSVAGIALSAAALLWA